MAGSPRRPLYSISRTNPTLAHHSDKSCCTHRKLIPGTKKGKRNGVGQLCWRLYIHLEWILHRHQFLLLYDQGLPKNPAQEGEPRKDAWFLRPFVPMCTLYKKEFSRERRMNANSVRYDGINRQEASLFLWWGSVDMVVYTLGKKNDAIRVILCSCCS